MHFNDWHTAAGPLLMRTAYAWDRLFAQSRTVLTVHNIGYQGIIGAARCREVLPAGRCRSARPGASRGRATSICCAPDSPMPTSSRP